MVATPFALPLLFNIHMISITKIVNGITKYAKLGKTNIVLPIYGCKNCNYQGKLHRHGYYCRNVISFYSSFSIFILRFKCPSCNKTFSILPSFLIPYYQYSYDVIFLCLYKSYVLNHSYSNIVTFFKSMDPKSSLKTSNIYSFKKRIRQTVSMTNMFFGNYPDFYFDMDRPSVASILKKIKEFNDTRGEFNHTYFITMPRYFMAKI